MNSFPIVDDEDIDFIWDTIQDQQIVFHPVIAPDGRFDYTNFFASKEKKT